MSSEVLETYVTIFCASCLYIGEEQIPLPSIIILLTFHSPCWCSTTCSWSYLNTYFLFTLRFCYTTTLAACRIFYHFNFLYTHKGSVTSVLLCAPPRHRAMWLNFLAQGKPLPAEEFNSVPLGFNGPSQPFIDPQYGCCCLPPMWKGNGLTPILRSMIF